MLDESNSRVDSDWQFVGKVLDLTEGHNNAQRARMIVAVLNQLAERRRADLVEAVSAMICCETCFGEHRRTAVEVTSRRRSTSSSGFVQEALKTPSLYPLIN